MKTYETQKHKEKSSKYFCEYLNNDGDGNERYRVGFENYSVYVLKRNPDSKLPISLSKYLTWGTQLNGFDFYIERNGQLVAITPSEKVTPYLYKARQAKELVRRTKYLDEKGFKQYCVQCASLAQSKAGSIGGTLKKNWNKGQTKYSDIRLKNLSKAYQGDGNPFYGQKHDLKLVEQIKLKQRLQFVELNKRLQITQPTITLLSNENEYKTQHSLLRIRCNTCNTEYYNATYFNLKRCWTCNVCNPNASKQQLEIANYIKSRLQNRCVEISTRNIIYPYELDIFIPDLNVAIEYHGLHWHTMSNKNDDFQKRHKLKQDLCKDKNIRLLQFYSDEWYYHKAVCKHYIDKAIGCCQQIILNDCDICDHCDEDFYDKNHLHILNRNNLLCKTIYDQENALYCILYESKEDTIIIDDILEKIGINISNIPNLLQKIFPDKKIKVLLRTRLDDIEHWKQFKYHIENTHDEVWYTNGHKRFIEFNNQYKHIEILYGTEYCLMTI
jgi:hypothetical protein